MKKVIYAMPAVIVCLVYGFLALLVGGFGGFQPIAWAYIGLPLLAAVLLIRGKWWGCLPGLALGAVLISLDTLPMLGLGLGVYYAAGGWICFRSNRTPKS